MSKRIYKLSPIVKEAIWGGENIFNIAEKNQVKLQSFGNMLMYLKSLIVFLGVITR